MPSGIRTRNPTKRSAADPRVRLKKPAPYIIKIWKYLRPTSNQQPTPWSRGLPEKLTGPQLLKSFPAFYGTRRVITAFTRARHLTLSLATSNLHR